MHSPDGLLVRVWMDGSVVPETSLSRARATARARAKVTARATHAYID